ncbi:hypothetical protein TIFTF001_012405 [Ficus carica]|uniref:Uncharacterized protein n=1 Tax=Ficus carica TaxID=3494 RepID=A0AA88D572_FICCA|nr:hypothetical protein TIFTF001_012405 [Ficus carica]
MIEIEIEIESVLPPLATWDRQPTIENVYVVAVDYGLAENSPKSHGCQWEGGKEGLLVEEAAVENKGCGYGWDQAGQKEIVNGIMDMEEGK